MDADNSFDRPEAGGVSEGPAERLAMLAARLGAHGLGVDVTRERVVVSDRDRPGVTVTITCHRRTDDDDRWWFFTLCGTPVAEVERTQDAVVAIRGHFAGSR